MSIKIDDTKQSSTEIRRVQALTGVRSLTVVLPRVFAEELGISKGDFLTVKLEDNRLVLQKASI
jgi:bifunctional DNA-binding transcriptional regulator/antitoxin component of YhaV-PrlF toxin-antitoxin module